MTTRLKKSRVMRRTGFTLVEMLTVIVIIGILAGLTTGAVIAARNAARRAIVVSEIKQLEMALQKYKSDVGEFPPDFAFCDEATPRGDAARSRVLTHLRKRFPKLRLATWADFTAVLTAAGAPSVGASDSQLNPSTALTFWLGGLIIDGKPRGFSQDPTNPFKASEPRSTPYYDFDPARMRNLQLIQPKIQPIAPYVYFRAVKENIAGHFEYGFRNDNGSPTDPTDDVLEPMSYKVDNDVANVCTPYLEWSHVKGDRTQEADPALGVSVRIWRAPETFQIIAAGLDGVFSTDTPSAFRFSKVLQGFPSGAAGSYDFTQGDYDNLANFADGELEDES